LPTNLFFFALYPEATGATPYQSNPGIVALLVTGLLIPGTGMIRKKSTNKLSKISKTFLPSLELLAAQTEIS